MDPCAHFQLLANSWNWNTINWEWQSTCWFKVRYNEWATLLGGRIITAAILHRVKGKKITQMYIVFCFFSTIESYLSQRRGCCLGRIVDCFQVCPSSGNHQQNRVNDAFTMGYELPRFFSWIYPGRLAGMSTPRHGRDIDILIKMGFTYLLTLTKASPLHPSLLYMKPIRYLCSVEELWSHHAFWDGCDSVSHSQRWCLAHSLPVVLAVLEQSWLAALPF